MNYQNLPESDPRHHPGNIKRMLNDVVQHHREDVDKINEPGAQCLFETSAEVLEGLVEASTIMNRNRKRRGSTEFLSNNRPVGTRHAVSLHIYFNREKLPVPTI